MTVLEAYRACLIELNKVQAPSLLIDDFVYLFNKGIQQYINRKYHTFEVTQQATDDLRHLTKTIKKEEKDLPTNQGDVFGTSYDCELPRDYMHMLNVICEFENQKDKCAKCPTFRVGAKKLTSNQWPTIVGNYYMKPSVRQPYYYIINIEDPEKYGSSRNDRDANSYKPMMQIKCGNETALKAVYIDYLRAPKKVVLTQADIDAVADPTEELEFSDYVIYEIINEVITIVLENTGNPRIQSQPAVTHTTTMATK